MSQLWWDDAEKENLGGMGCHRDTVSLLYTPCILPASTQDNTAPSCRLPSLFLSEMSKSQLFFFLVEMIQEVLNSKTVPPNHYFPLYSSFRMPDGLYTVIKICFDISG